jgi:hypothetical protein
MFFFSIRRTLLTLCALACAIAGLGYGARGVRQWAQTGLTPPPRADVAPGAGTAGAAITPGEILTYNVGWSTYPTAARLDMEVVDRGAFFGYEGFELRTRIETTPAIRSLFLDLDSEYTTYVETRRLLPHRLELSVRQGAKQTDETVLVDQQNRRAVFRDDSKLDLPGEIHDLPSLLYALRILPFSAGTKQKFTALYERNVIEIEAEGRETARITTSVGAYEAICVQITAKAKKHNLSKYRIKVWLSNDARRLPVLLTARLPFGEVRAELVNVSVNTRPESVLVREKSGEGAKGNPAIYTEIERGRPFGVGERLNYDVSWENFVSIGKAGFAVRQRGRIGEFSVIELVGEASSTGAARSLMDVDDQLISFVEVNTLAPVRSEIRLREGQRVKQTVADYNWSDLTVRLTNGTHFKVEPQTLDLVSLFYHVRAADLKLGQVYNYTLLGANHRPAHLVCKAVKYETIGGPLGPRNALQLDFYSRETSRTIAQLWLGQDPARLPLYLAVRTRFGEIRFQLQSTHGAR